jgi:hypothetical protein
MFGLVLAITAGLAFVGLGVRSVLQTTGDKVEAGDSVFLPTNALMAVDPVAAVNLVGFLAGITVPLVRVNGVIPDGKGGAIGSLASFAPPVKFFLVSVARIERNGVQFT